MKLETILLSKISQNKKNIHTYSKPMRILQFIKCRNKELYKDILNDYSARDTEFIAMLEKFYSPASSSEKGRFEIFNSWPLEPYMTDNQIIERMQAIKTGKPRLANRANKIIQDIYDSRKFRDEMNGIE